MASFNQPPSAWLFRLNVMHRPDSSVFLIQLTLNRPISATLLASLAVKQEHTVIAKKVAFQRSNRDSDCMSPEAPGCRDRPCDSMPMSISGEIDGVQSPPASPACFSIVPQCDTATRRVRGRRTESDFNWPQAAMISSPLGVRMGAA